MKKKMPYLWGALAQTRASKTINKYTTTKPQAQPGSLLIVQSKDQNTHDTLGHVLYKGNSWVIIVSTKTYPLLHRNPVTDLEGV